MGVIQLVLLLFLKHVVLAQNQYSVPCESVDVDGAPLSTNEWIDGRTACSVSCGGGSREKGWVKKDTDGTCTFDPRETEECNTHPCPVDCVQALQPTFTYGPCTATCGLATRTQRITYKILTQPQNGGKACTPTSTSTVSCNLGGCPVDCVQASKPTTTYGPCSVTCGSGFRTRTKSYTVLKEPQNGGKACKKNEIFRRSPCNRISCPVHCGQRSKYSYGPCSEMCGNSAKQTVTRTYTVYREPTTGGRPCKDDEHWERSCNRQSEVTGYGPCTTTCGPGVQFYQRVVTDTKQAQQGYKRCESNYTSSSPSDCQNDPCPVDCEEEVTWTNSSCSSSCGPGTRTMVSTVNITTEAEHNGKDCQKAQNLTEACYVEECPGGLSFDMIMREPKVQGIVGVGLGLLLLALMVTVGVFLWRRIQPKMKSRAAARRPKSQENPTYASGLYYTEEGERIQESEAVDHNALYGQADGVAVIRDVNSEYE